MGRFLSAFSFLPKLQSGLGWLFNGEQAGGQLAVPRSPALHVQMG